MHDWKCIVSFNFEHNFQANKITMARPSRWQSIWPITQTNRNQEMGESTKRQSG
jgi:hypothetical protein